MHVKALIKQWVVFMSCCSCLITESSRCRRIRFGQTLYSVNPLLRKMNKRITQLNYVMHS